MPRDIPFGSNLNNCKVAGEWYCGAGLDATNTPPNPFGETAFGLKVEKTYALGIKQTLFWYYSGSSYYRTFTGEEWTEWVKIATATKPAVYDLPLAAGVTGECKYSKDQFGKLLITCIYVTTTRAVAAGETIATLPKGYRLPGPTGIRVLAFLGNALGNLYIDPNGSIATSAAVAAGAVICAGSVAFVTA